MGPVSGFFDTSVASQTCTIDLGDVWNDLSSTCTSDQSNLDFIVIYNVLGWKSSVDMLAYAGKCWQVLAYAGICWHMLGGPAEWVVAL